MIDEEYTKRSRYSCRDVGSYHVIGYASRPMGRRDYIETVCERGSVQKRESDPLKDPDDEDRPKRAKNNKSKEC